ncbi:hypothetical protein NliqN6_5693 [Naganishia liquefaciens]|uniref:Glycosyltransferase n=1 Tax=Naganishia liquefaciens TaxID=104408 RepID=A0A8H3YJ84_9TREE|nr:hypothetical protein NliqN6_5693 [Naganishia liquefaciens]
MIVTENFLPKVDGVTRTLARLLTHLEAEGHECMVLGPQTGMSHFASHPLVGTLGVPLVLYPGLKLNFLRPRFLSKIQHWEPDVIHFVDPIWLGGQTMLAMDKGWAGRRWAQSGTRTAHGEAFEGAVVASYHTNLATYATLFGLPWLEPIIWKWQTYLLSKTSLTMCPSPSTAAMLHTKRVERVRTWPRGVDLPQLYPVKRSEQLRESWGIESIPSTESVEQPSKNPKSSFVMPLTPPLTPVTVPADIRNDRAPNSKSERLVALFVSRMSWEKNLLLLIKALTLLPAHLPAGTQTPKMVFVGHGPAQPEIQRVCREKGIDAEFMGYQEKEELARCYASADFFCFPSFTETFGQVVLEALAFGLPVIGLDADGTRDLVKPELTGLLLPLPDGNGAQRLRGWPYTMRDWHEVCKDASSPLFLHGADGYARLIAKVMVDHELRKKMSRLACTEGVRGYTWWDAMERCVDGYREALQVKIAKETHSEDRNRVRRTGSRSLTQMSPFERKQFLIRRALRLVLVIIAIVLLLMFTGL